MKSSVASLRKVSGIIPESVADLTGIRILCHADAQAALVKGFCIQM
jgi:hypothetical protein